MSDCTYSVTIVIKSKDGKSITLSCNTNDSIADVKAAAAKKGFGGGSAETMRLVFAGNELEDDEALLSDYHISKHAILHLVNGNSLTVKTPAGRVVAFEWTEQSKTEDVQKEVESKLFIPADLQLLLCGEEQDILESGQTLKQQNVRNNAMVNLAISIPGLPVFIQTCLPSDEKSAGGVAGPRVGQTVMARTVKKEDSVNKVWMAYDLIDLCTSILRVWLVYLA